MNFVFLFFISGRLGQTIDSTIDTIDGFRILETSIVWT